MKYDPDARPFWEPEGGPISNLMLIEDRVKLLKENRSKIDYLQCELLHLELERPNSPRIDKIKKRLVELGGRPYVRPFNYGRDTHEPALVGGGYDGNGNRRKGHGVVRLNNYR